MAVNIPYLEPNGAIPYLGAPPKNMMVPAPQPPPQAPINPIRPSYAVNMPPPVEPRQPVDPREEELRKLKLMAILSAVGGVFANATPKPVKESPFVGIGKGLTAGTNTYMEGMKNIQSRYNQQKEFNMPAKVDEFLAYSQADYGADYGTAEGRKIGWNWFGTPIGQQKWKEYLKLTAEQQYRPRYTPYSNASAIEMVDLNDPEQVAQAKASGLEPGMPQQIGATEKAELNDTRALKQILDETNTLYNYDDSGKGTRPGRKWVGLFEGPKGAVTGKTGVGADKREQLFRRKYASLVNMIGRLRAGTAWTQSEIDRIKEELGSLSDSEVKFEAGMQSIEDLINNKLSQMSQTQKETRTYMRPQGKAKPKYELLP